MTPARHLPQAFEVAVTYFAEDKAKASPDEFFNHFNQFRQLFQVQLRRMHSCIMAHGMICLRFYAMPYM